MTTIIVIGHAGHWAASLLYAMPVIAFLVFLGVSVVRDRMGGSNRGGVRREKPSESEDVP